MSAATKLARCTKQPIVRTGSQTDLELVVGLTQFLSFNPGQWEGLYEREPLSSPPNFVGLSEAPRFFAPENLLKRVF